MDLVKKSILSTLIKNKRYDSIEELPFEDIGQGYGYKNYEAFLNGDNYICYIPEYCYNEDTYELDLDSCYTKTDFCN